MKFEQEDILVEDNTAIQLRPILFAQFDIKVIFEF